MDTQVFMKGQKDLIDRVDKLEEDLGNISTLISRLGIDNQVYLRANDPVAPGIACKVAFDQNGLIRKGYSLDVSDIPDLPIEKILNLRDSLDRKSESSTKRELPSRPVRKEIAGTGTKVNYDEDGRVVSVSDLLPSDIPELPIEKISGLIDRLKIIEELHDADNNPSEFKVPPGVGVKVIYDSSGRVLRTDKLTIDDIPHELIARLNILESNTVNYASSSALDSIRTAMKKKLDANEYMTPGTYMKVKVDHNGLVVGYEEVTKKDLPPITMSDVEGLEKILRSKADQSSFIELHETLASLSSLPAKVGEISSIKEGLSKKADQEEVSVIKNQISSINNFLQTVMDKIPNDTIIEFLDQIRTDLSGISGRVAALENKFSKE